MPTQKKGEREREREGERSQRRENVGGQQGRERQQGRRKA